MATGLHKDLEIAELHRVCAYEYANASARTGATGFVSTDIGKFARQLDDNSVWMLTAVTPTWKQIDGGSAGYVPTSRTITTQNGIQGGGDLSADRTISPTYGTAVNTVCQGNDSRLSDARTPTTHATSHQSGGGDAVKLDDLSAPDDNTDLDASTSKHGLLLKLGGGSTNFLRADGTWAAPSGTDSNAIHKSTSAEISTITEKTLPFRDDLVIIEDSQDSNSKKRVKVGNVLAAEPYYFAGPAVFFDEFYPPALNNQWTTSTSGTGSLIELILATGGQVLVRAGNAAGRFAELYFGGAVAWQTVSATTKRISMRAKYDGTSNATVEFEAHYADASNYVLLRAAWGGNWFLRTMSGGVETAVDTGVALDTSWHVFRIDVGSGQVDAYIDGVLKATSTTNIPTATGTVSIWVSATGTGGTKNLSIDGFHYLSERAT